MDRFNGSSGGSLILLLFPELLFLSKKSCWCLSGCAVALWGPWWSRGKACHPSLSAQLPCAGTCHHSWLFKAILEMGLRTWRGREGGTGTCVSMSPSNSRLGCGPDFTSLGILRAIFFLSAGISVLSPLPSSKSTSFLLLFTSLKPCVTHFPLQ